MPAHRIPEEQRQRILQALQNRGALRSCPMCGSGRFSVFDGYLHHPAGPGPFDQRPDMIFPMVAAICSHCGFVSQHALGQLGLTDD